MGPWRALGRQLANPSGVSGRLLGGVMDLANRRPVRLAIERLDPRPGERILDAGCGTGRAMALTLSRAACDVVGVDRSSAMIAAARARLARAPGPGRAHVLHGELGALQLAAGACDAVLAINVLYFSDEEGEMVADLRRMLRPGGRLIVYVTHEDSMRRWPFANRGTHRLFNQHTLVGALCAGGFSSTAMSAQSVPISRSVMGLFASAIA